MYDDVNLYAHVYLAVVDLKSKHITVYDSDVKCFNRYMRLAHIKIVISGVMKYCITGLGKKFEKTHGRSMLRRKLGNSLASDLLSIWYHISLIMFYLGKKINLSPEEYGVIDEKRTRDIKNNVLIKLLSTTDTGKNILSALNL